MRKIIIRLVINAIAIYVAVVLLNGNGMTVQNNGGWGVILFLAVILGLLNALLRPLLMFLSCPLIILTLGLGTLLVNTLIFYLTGAIGSQFGLGFMVDGFWPAFLGALIVSLVSVVLSIFLKDDQKNHHRK